MPIVNITIDSYAVLGVSRDANIKEINAVYKQLALKSHPDKTGGTDAATERFREVDLSSSRDTYIANAVPTDQRCR